MWATSGGVAGIETFSSSMAERLPSLLPMSEARPDANIEGEDPALVGKEDVEDTVRCIDEDGCDEAPSILLLDEPMSVMIAAEQPVGLSRGIGRPAESWDGRVRCGCRISRNLRV